MKPEMAAQRRYAMKHHDNLGRVVRGRWHAERRGHVVTVTDGIRVWSFKARATPLAEDLLRRVAFWSNVQPSWGPEEVGARALLDQECVLAQRTSRRRGVAIYPYSA